MAVFGFVTASLKELTENQQKRYNTVYCGICRQIRLRAGQSARLGLSYDMAFLALLLMSLYEPEEQSGARACSLHPVKPKPWVDNEYIQYAADMNVLLAYYKAVDDCNDDHSLKAAMQARMFGKNCKDIAERYPRQSKAIVDCIGEISRLEGENCPNPDQPAGAFGRLMGEILVYHEDIWAPTLQQLGLALGRFIYLADGAVDYRKDRRKGRYNPYLAMGTGEDWTRWEEYLVLSMGACTAAFEKLPLVQDKPILDNILYSGVWGNFRRQKQQGKGDGND